MDNLKAEGTDVSWPIAMPILGKPENFDKVDTRYPDRSALSQGIWKIMAKTKGKKMELEDNDG
jgi:hypothetical protein